MIPGLQLSSSFSMLLEILISLGFVYFLFSVLGSMVVEQWSHIIRLRSRFLMQWLDKLLDDPANKNFAYLVYNHPLIDALKTDKNNPAKYIASSSFAQAFIDVIGQQAIQYQFEKDEDGNWKYLDQGHQADKVKSFYEGAQALKPSAFKDLLLSFLSQNCQYQVLGADEFRVQNQLLANNGEPQLLSPFKNLDNANNLSRLQVSIQNWYQNYMDRLTGHYKGKTGSLTKWASIAVVLAFNIDSLHLLTVLRTNKDLRESLVVGAEKLVDEKEKALTDSVNYYSLAIKALANKDTSLKSSSNETAFLNKLNRFIAKEDTVLRQHIKNQEKMVALIEAYSLPIGWHEAEVPLVWFKKKGTLSVDERKTWDCLSLLKYLLGISISIVALSFGAPFWFDVLNKFINVRRAGIKPKESAETNA